VTSAITTVRYDSSFGFYTFPVDGLKTYTLGGTTLGIGYLFQTATPWIGYSFSKIIFPNNLTPTGSPTLIAKVYNITPSIYYNLLKSGLGSITPFDLTTKGTLIVSSTPVLLSTSSPVTLSFSSKITITSSTVILLQLTGSGSVTVSAYSSVNQTLYATSLLYTNAGIYNDYITNTRGMICQFR
jgi:hypothetical protein